MICQYCGKPYQEVTDTRPSYTCYSCNREFVSVHPSVLDKFETELAKKDAEIERLNDSNRNLGARLQHLHLFNDEANKQRLELQSLRSKIERLSSICAGVEVMEHKLERAGEVIERIKDENQDLQSELQSLRSRMDKAQRDNMKCPSCNGTGVEHNPDYDPCFRCDGNGTIQVLLMEVEEK